MNNQDADVTPGSVQQAIQQIWKQSPNLTDGVAEELKVALERLQSLPFKNEEQRASLFESFQCLQGYHVVQVFNVGVSRIQKSVKEPSKYVAKVLTLFQLCTDFCYQANSSKRVSFEHYVRALKLCFPSDPNKSCLSIETVSMLLKLVQILQEGKLCATSFMDLAKPVIGPKDLFDEILTSLESKPYDKSDVVEIISQTLRFASADATTSTVFTNAAKNLPDLPFKIDQAIPAVFLRNWIDLLQLTKAGDAAFILRLASEDPLNNPLTLPIHMSPFCYTVQVLQSMKEKGDQVDLNHDEDRLDVFFRNIKHFLENGDETTVTLLKLLSSKNISDTVLAEVYKQFFFKSCGEPQHVGSHKAQALESIRQLLLALPEGSLVVRVLNFWNDIFPHDSDYTILEKLMELFVGLSTKGSASKGFDFEERAERLLNFITSVRLRSIIPWIHAWAPFLEHLIAVLPTSFEKLPGLPIFIRKVAQRATNEQKIMPENQDGALSFFNWLSKQRRSVKVKEDMADLFLRYVDPTSGCNLFVVDLIKSLCVRTPLPLNYMKTLIQEMVCFSSHFEPCEKGIIRDFVSKVVALDQSLVNREDILTELCITMKHLWNDEKAPKNAGRVKTFELMSLLSKDSLSSLKTTRLFQLSRNSTDGLSCCIRYVQLITSTSKIFKEKASQHFELLFAAFFETLNGNVTLCEILFRYHCQFTAFFAISCPSVGLLNIWICVVAGLLSLDLFKEEVDLQCCMPVLARATGFDSPFRALQLYFSLRSVFSRLISQSRERIPGFSFTQEGGKDTPLSNATPDQLGSVVEALSVIVQSDVSPPEAKLLLIDKICELVLKKPEIMTGDILPHALGNIIPFHSRISPADVCPDNLELHHILERPEMLEQLAHVPTSRSKSLFSILLSKIPKPLTKDDIVLIFDRVASFKNANKVFLDHLLVLLESITKVCSSVSDVLDLLMEAEGSLREISSELIPLFILIFSYLVEHRVAKRDRAAFIKQVALKWESPCDLNMCTDYEIPQLLWKAYERASSVEGKSEAIDRIHEVVLRSKELEMHAPNGKITEMNCVQRSIACRDLEWLALHSSLGSKDVALCFHLSSSYPAVHGLKCFSSVSGMEIQDGCLKPIPPQQSEAGSKNGEKRPSRVYGCTQDSFSEQATSSQLPLLTPAVIAHKMIVQLRRLLVQDDHLRDIAIQLWNYLFANQCLPCIDDVCKSSKWPSTSCKKEIGVNYPLLNDYVNVFLSILSRASSVEVMLHWASIDHHHACQCSEVILKACEWKGDNNNYEAVSKLQSLVWKTLEKTRLNARGPPWVFSAAPCFRLLKPQFMHICSILDRRIPFEVTTGVLTLYQINFQAGVTVGEIVSLWSCQQQSLNLVEKIKSFCEGDEMASFNPAQIEFAWQLLKAYGHFCLNSCEDLLATFNELIVMHDPDDAYGLNRLPNWRQTMIEEGFPAQAINRWCLAFLMTPLEFLRSRDVDAIVDLNSRFLGLVTSVSPKITSLIFPEDGFPVKKGEGIKERLVKERIRLARLLGEFINILKVRKPEDNPKDAVVKGIVVDSCVELCDSHENETQKRNDLYKIHGQKLKALFTEIFGKRRQSEDGQVSIQDCGMTHRASGQELRMAVSIARQSSYLHENLPYVLSHKDIYEPMLVLLRRWLSGIVTKPTLASHTLDIVQLLFSLHPSNAVPNLLDKLHDIIQSRILSLEENQSLVAQLQAVGYNQRREGIPDLWSSRVVELPGYLSKRENPSSRLYRKKLTKVLRPLWNELKDILLMFRIGAIKVGEEEVCGKDLFGFQASLEEMEKQAAAVREAVKQINSEDVQRRVNQLMRLEQRHRARIEKHYKSKNSPVKCDEVNKFVVVWENRFLEQVKMCSERIPGCYAPNGFHSEKPVLCALSVDNRILTVFKEEKPGRREEIENVEVKLFEAGVYVYGLHPSGHDYVTDELWAAFYKKLLEDRLVPSIVLSTESPGFDWIKEFVQPATSHPCPWNWELHHSIVPPEEDYFDFLPITAALWPDLHGLREFITLSEENVSSFEFRDFKDTNTAKAKEKLTKEMAGKVIQQLQRELRLLHGVNESIIKALAGKLTFAVKETVKSIVDGVQATEETVKELIDMKKLAFGHSEVERTEESRQHYAAAVLRACEHARSTLT